MAEEPYRFSVEKGKQKECRGERDTAGPDAIYCDGLNVWVKENIISLFPQSKDR
ncbi:hypothetical protein NQZ68_024764 [Dissostichus eleginoides]|nr:hypothetical protein NQZ68_024764 [Dissostichus eleginoides]